MKKYNLKFAVLALLATLAVSSCSVHRHEHRKPRHHRNDDHRGDDQRGNDRN